MHLDRESELVESIHADLQFLDIHYLYSDLLVGIDVAYLQDHDIFILGIDLSVDCLFALRNYVLVLLLGFLFLFDCSLYPPLAETGREAVDAVAGADGEFIHDF